jgi:hypothetical protein
LIIICRNALMVGDHHLRERHVLGVVVGGGRSGSGVRGMTAHGVVLAAAAGGEREGGERDDEQRHCGFHRCSTFRAVMRPAPVPCVSAADTTGMPLDWSKPERFTAIHAIQATTCTSPCFLNG